MTHPSESSSAVDYDDDPAFVCPLRGEACVRAFCEDYGCADKLRVPLDEYDYAAGSTNWNELLPSLPRMIGKRSRKP